jgi:hypothetical protein
VNIVYLSEGGRGIKNQDMFSIARRRALREMDWSTLPNEAEYIEAWQFSNVINLLLLELAPGEARANRLKGPPFNAK